MVHQEAYDASGISTLSGFGTDADDAKEELQKKPIFCWKAMHTSHRLRTRASFCHWMILQMLASICVVHSPLQPSMQLSGHHQTSIFISSSI